jgi:hypothetical protein
MTTGRKVKRENDLTLFSSPSPYTEREKEERGGKKSSSLPL